MVVKISVVLPVYNEAQYLRPCLESLLNQTQKAHEIIVVDNNSTDDTVAIAKEFKDVTLIHEKQQGITPARNAGFNYATGDVLARCDADSILPPNWLEKINKNFSGRKKIDALVGLNKIYDFPVKNVMPLNRAIIMLIKEVTGHYPLYGPSMAISKKMWNTIKGSVCLDDKLVHEDVDLSVHIYDAGGKIAFDPTFLASFSARRLKRDPYQLLIEYPSRIVKTIRRHKSDFLVIE